MEFTWDELTTMKYLIKQELKNKDYVLIKGNQTINDNILKEINELEQIKKKLIFKSIILTQTENILNTKNEDIIKVMKF